MIVVTGTMRSGTSMWMQALAASGLELIGAEFPANWKQRIGAANSKGFFESILRGGIYYRTNPHPETGTYLSPDETRLHVVKVFAQGLVRSEIAFLHRVVLTIRPFREYVSSITRLMEIERRAKARELGRDVPAQLHIPHALRWWDDNFSAFRDSLIRGYPTHAIAYDTVLEDRDAVARTLHWVGAPDVEAGLACIDRGLRTQQHAETSRTDDAACGAELTAAAVEVFDELYDRVRSSRGFDPGFLARMNQTDELLRPQFAAARARLRREKRARRLDASSSA
jgi:hypothetical protein